MHQMSLFSTEENDQNFNTLCEVLGCKNNISAWPDKFGEALRSYNQKNSIRKIRTLSLFSGAGGLDIGFSDAGFDIVESVEIERSFCNTLELNSGVGRRFSQSKVNCIDIREYTGKSLGDIDFIIGGPPCQTFSAAGRRAAGVLGTMDSRGVLFREYVRLLKELSPRGSLFENVYGIIGAQKGTAWQEILLSFTEVGYKLFYRILDAADYGVPQHRERLIIVGLKDGNFEFPRPTHGPDSIDEAPFYTAGCAIRGINFKDEERKSGINGRYGNLLTQIPPGLNYSFFTEKMGHPAPIFAWRSKFSDFLYKADPNEPVRTIKAQGGQYTGPFHWENRAFSLSEYKRLQTFPDDYEISGNKQTAIKQIGNSVPPQLARIMAIAIRQQVFNTYLPYKIPLIDSAEELSFRKRKSLLTSIYKKKSKQAIDKISHHKLTLPQSRNYNASLTGTFSLLQKNSEEGEFYISVKWEKVLKLEIYEKNNIQQRKAFSICITPAGKRWGLPVDNVYVDCFSSRMEAFTIAWKAIEQELISNSFKADLIQLNGYYQYKPKIICTYTATDSKDLERILSLIVNGSTIRQIYSSAELAQFWGIDKNLIMNYALELRKLGYEIRNHNTNPQIEQDYWLIPYAFPTLTPMSVQLRKKLG